MKAYTNIEQSKKLAEILPPETADMKWYFWKSEIDAPKLPTFGYSKTAAESYKDTEAVYLPCWSLAALLGVLPEIQGGKPIIALDDNYITYPHISDLHTKADNIIDACVDMIIKLNEQNLL